MNTFEEIYAENRMTMFRVAKKMIGDCDDVSDIIQEVFIDLFNKLKNGNEIRHPKSWLYRATFNKCIDNVRKQKRFQHIDFVYYISLLSQARGGPTHRRQAGVRLYITICCFSLSQNTFLPSRNAIVAIWADIASSNP